MYVDNTLIVSGGVSSTGTVTYQTVTGSSAVLSTNSIDLTQNRDIGEGSSIAARFLVGTAFAGLTALDLEVITADDAALSTNVTSIGAIKSVPVASLAAGARFAVEVSPRIGSKGQEFIGIRYTPTGTGTAGTVFADFGIEIQDTAGKSYPNGFSVK